MNFYHEEIKKILIFISKINENNFSQKQIEKLILALLSPTEIVTFSQRLEVLKLLSEGKSQREVSETLRVGVATATRGNRILKENWDLFKHLYKKST